MAILIYIFAFLVWTTISALLAASGDISGGFMFAFMLFLFSGVFNPAWLVITSTFALTECAFGFLRTRWRVLAFCFFEVCALCIIAAVVWSNDPLKPNAFKMIFYPALGVAVVYFLRSATRTEPISFYELGQDEKTSADTTTANLPPTRNG